MTTDRWLWLLIGMGLLLRVGWLVYRADDLAADPDAYVGHARTLVESGCYCVPGSNHPTAYRPPLYPLLLAGLMVFGVSSAAAIVVINLAASVVTTAAAWQLCVTAGVIATGRRIGVFMVLADPLLLRYTSLPMTEVLCAALLAVAVTTFLRATTEGTPDRTALGERSGSFSRQVLFAAIVSGICFGLCALARPTVLVTSALLIGTRGLQIVWQRLRSRRAAPFRNGLWRSVAAAMVVGVCAGLVLLPWIVRNLLQFHSFIPATTHGGYTLLLGNNAVFYEEVVRVDGHPPWSGKSLDRWQRAVQQEMAHTIPPGTSEPAEDQWMYARAQQEIRGDPEGFLYACLLRWKRFWAVLPESVDGSLPLPMRLLSTCWYGGLWIGLAATMLFPAIRRRSHVQLMWSAILSFLLLHTVYWTNTRMRAPLTAVLVVLAVTGWQHLLTGRKP
ncbi:MAG: hypothetical protein KDA89_11365 [Planctomycetaceae bacterium]|nr:hypothetical protein [Planctomycetaceae bacterium]